MSILNKPAKLLDDGWCWVEYDDGSGHLENPNGKSVISYDYTTQEYRDVHGNWRFMNNYPDTTPMDMFMAEMEIDIARLGIAEYSKEFMKIIDLQNKLFNLSRCDYSPSYSNYVNVYNHSDEMYKVLLEYEKATKDEMRLDLDIVNELGEFYSRYAICDLLTDSHKEILIDAVEFERDWGNDVPAKVFNIYNLICMEQGETEEPQMNTM